MTAGRVSSIYLTAKRGGPAASVGGATAVADRGLAGDRYYAGEGSFSRWPGSGRAVSFIEQEAIDAILAEYGLDLSAGVHRRNVVTSGVRLADFNGRRFRAGTALFRGARLCAPCKYLERLVGPNTFDPLRGRGGLRADIWETGEFAVGDVIVPYNDRAGPVHALASG